MIRVLGKYLGVQVVAYAIDMGVFLLLSAMGSGPIIANVIAKIAAGAFAFVVHRRVTFEVHEQGGAGRQLVRYVALLALNIPVSSALLAVLLPWISPPALAKFASDVVCVGLTFVASRYLVFRGKQAGESP